MYLYTFMKKYKPVPHHVVLYCFSLEKILIIDIPGNDLWRGGGGAGACGWLLAWIFTTNMICSDEVLAVP